ncbi:hypothetical protein QZH41_018560 [Actinostola sp. cb2023]|nr:hypothetical protein QZH41_018560 [Actinostola sp. cb2023]
MSALIVTGIDHRLCMAPRPQNDANYGHQSIEEWKALEMDPVYIYLLILALDRFRQDAEKQKVIEEEQYKDKMHEFRQESQNLIQKRRKERIKKEEISSKVLHQTHEYFMDLSDSEEDDQDARQAMDDIEKFEARLRQQEILKPS